MKKRLLSATLLIALPLLTYAQAAPDIATRLSRLKPVEMHFDTSSLSKSDIAVVRELTHALTALESIYLRQIDPPALDLYLKLTANGLPPASTPDGALARYIAINGSRFDLFSENKPFVGTTPIPPGRAFYPLDLTQSEIDAYVAKFPAQKSALYQPYAVIRRNGDRLEAVPYHVAYAPILNEAAASLRRAAALTTDAAFARFLNLRADALLSDDYYPSDIAWLDLKQPKIDLIFAPYETYNDGLLGTKATYGAAILIRNDAESKKLELFQRYVADLQDALPVPAEDRPSKHGMATPMEVVDSPFRAGDLLHGYQVVADNLPNDPRIHAEKGSKKIFFKNFMDARVNEVVLPTAKQVMDPQQAALASSGGYLAFVMMHEICHGLGPVFARTPQGRQTINEAIGPGAASLEEAKADVVGMFGLDWLINHDALPASQRSEYYASFVAGIFRSIRFGTGETHSRAEMMEFNYLVEQGAILRTASGRYRIDESRFPIAIQSLAHELLTIEATGDRTRNDQWFAKYGALPADVKATLEQVHGVPLDITPVFDFPVILK